MVVLIVLVAAALLGAVPVAIGSRWAAVLGITVVAMLASAARDASARLAILLIPWLALLRRLTGGPDAYVPNDPLVLLVPLLLVPPLLAFIALRPDPGLSRMRLAWLGFIGWAGLVTALVPGAAPTVRAYGLLTVLVPAVLGYAVFEGLHPRLPRLAVLSTLVLAPLAAFYGLTQYVVDPPWDMAWLADRQQELISVGRPEHREYRVFGSMESPGPFAVYLGLGLVSMGAFALWPHRRPRPWVLPFAALAGVTMVSALILSATRSVLFGLPLVAMLGLLFVRGRKRGHVAVVTVVLALATLLVPVLVAGRLYDDAGADRLNVGQVGEDHSFQARLNLLDQFRIVLRVPWGTGLGSSGRATLLETGESVAYLDNGYLAIAQETGLIGLVAFLFLLRTAVVEGSRGLSRHEGEDRTVLGACLLIALYFAVLLLTGSMLSIPSVVIFWIALGLLTRQSDAKPSDAQARHDRQRPTWSRR